jgi:hypothetical protein
LNEIQKTPEIITRLDAFFERSLSASAMNKYLACPLDFYYKDVLEFGEEDKVEEEVENNTFGTFIHNALENMYAPFARYDKEGNKREPAPKSITSFDIDHMLKHYEDEIRNQFMIHFCSQLGDIFRLYFFLQLSRVAKPHTVRWVLIGILISIPWGVAKQMEVKWGIDGLAVVPRFRDFFVGTVGALACLRTLWSIRGIVFHS